MVRKGFKPEQDIGKLREAKILIAEWRKEYNQVSPHSSKGYKPLAPEARTLVTLTL